MTTTITGATGVNQITDDAITYTKLPAGSTAQVVQTVKTNASSYTINNTWVDAAGLSVTITPSAASSKVKVSFSVLVTGSGNTPYPKIKILRNGADIIIGDTNGGRVRATSAAGTISSTADLETVSFEYLDSPATTSAITYKLQVNGYNNREFNINATNIGDGNSGVSGVSAITVMEIIG